MDDQSASDTGSDGKTSKLRLNDETRNQAAPKPPLTTAPLVGYVRPDATRHQYGFSQAGVVEGDNQAVEFIWV
jgi:hypothetical protein